jgi:hypothetical protein
MRRLILLVCLLLIGCGGEAAPALSPTDASTPTLPAPTATAIVTMTPEPTSTSTVTPTVRIAIPATVPATPTRRPSRTPTGSPTTTPTFTPSATPTAVPTCAAPMQDWFEQVKAIYVQARASIAHLASAIHPERDQADLEGALAKAEALKVPDGYGLDYEAEDWAAIVAELRSAVAMHEHPSSYGYINEADKVDRLWEVFARDYRADLKLRCPDGSN